MAEPAPLLQQLRVERAKAWAAVEACARAFLAAPTPASVRDLRLACDAAETLRRACAALRDNPR
jgi:hypothetical protein